MFPIIDDRFSIKALDERIERHQCPFYYRPEYCERCDGYSPICPRPDMRPIQYARPVGYFVRDFLRQFPAFSVR